MFLMTLYLVAFQQLFRALSSALSSALQLSSALISAFQLSTSFPKLFGPTNEEALATYSDSKFQNNCDCVLRFQTIPPFFDSF